MQKVVIEFPPNKNLLTSVTRNAATYCGVDNEIRLGPVNTGVILFAGTRMALCKDEPVHEGGICCHVNLVFDRASNKWRLQEEVLRCDCK